MEGKPGRPVLFLTLLLILPALFSFSALNTHGAQYINESNLYNLTFENLTAMNLTMASGQNATYTINITNYGNDTRDEYNLSLSSIGTLNQSFINLSMNESVEVVINVSNSTQGNFETYIIANYWNGTSTEAYWNLTSDDDGIVTNTTVDTTAPAITTDSPANTSYTTLPIDLNVTTSDNTWTDTCLYNLDGGGNTTLSNDSSTNWFTELSPSEGTHQLNVYCNDSVNNTGLNSTMWFTYDATAPTITIVSPTNISYTSLPIDLNVTTSDATTYTETCLYNLDGGGNTTLSNDSSTNWFIEMNPGEGTHQLNVYCNDSQNNMGLNNTIWFTYDQSAPTITITSPTNTSYTSLPINLNVTTSDTTYTDTCLYNLDGGTNYTLSNDSSTNWFTELSPSEGTHQLNVYCNDSQDNMGLNSTIWFVYSSGAPSSIITVSPTLSNGSTNSSGYFEVNVTFTDDTPSTCLLNLDNGTAANYTMTMIGGHACYFNATNQANGNWNYSVYINDSVGNWGWNGTWYITIDKRPVFGVLHSIHTTLSDGTETQTQRVSDMQTNYDWGSTVDHDSLLSASEWTLTRNEANGNNSDSFFIYFPGYEWKGANFNNAEITIFFIGNGPASHADGSTASYDTLTEILAWMQSNNGIGTANHPARNGNVWDWTDSVTDNETLIPSVEMINKDDWYWNEYWNCTSASVCTNYSNPKPWGTVTWTGGVKAALDQGRHLGFVAGWDYHGAYPGTPTAYTGLAKVDNWTREGVFDAILMRHTWASENRTVMNVTYDNGSEIFYMGDAFNSSASSIWINFTLTASGSDTIANTSLFIDGIIHNITTYSSSSVADAFNITFTDNDEHYIFIEAAENDDTRAWSSPMFITNGVDVTPPTVTVTSPLNQTYSSSPVNLNVTTSDNIWTDSCLYNLDGGGNATLSNTSTTNWYVEMNPSEGTHQLNVYCNDSAGNFALNNTIYFTYDATAPTITVVSPANTSYTSLPINLNVTTSDTTYTDTCLYNLDGGGNTTLSNDSSTNWFTELSPSEGTHQLNVYCNDSQDNMGLNSTMWFTYDASPPTLYVDSPLNQTYSSTTIQLNVSANETIDTWWYQLNTNGTNETFSPNTTIGSFQQGLNNMTVWANDTSGNENSTSVWFTVDTVAPTIQVDAPANQTYSSFPIDLNVTTSDATTWTDTCLYNLDGGGNTTLSNDSSTNWFIEISSASDGTRQLNVYCNDSQNNMGLNSTIWFVVDTSGPFITMGSPLNQTYGSLNVAINVSASETISTWWYQLNSNGTNETFTPNTTVTGVDGMNNITVWANDTYGNENSTTVFFEIDTSAIGITIDNPANQSYNSLPINLNVTTNMAASACLYNLNGGSNTTLSNSSTTNWYVEMNPSEATHQLNVYCNNTLGNFNLNTLWFTYDSTAPEIYVDSPANQTYNYTSIQLNVSANETIDTWWYQLNANGTNETFTPNTTITGAEGLNNITVWVNDSAGNENSTTVYFTIDTTAPTITIVSPTNTSYTTLPINLNVTTSDAATWTDYCLYNLNWGGNTTLSNDSATNWFVEMNPFEGTHQLNVYCNDSQDNMNLNNTIWFTYDGSLPTIYVDSPANQTYNYTSIQFNVSANETISTWWYQLNSNGTNETFTPNTTVTGVDGMNNITVWANDSVGNENSTTIYFTIDTTAPTITIDNPVNNSNHTSFPIDLNATTGDAADICLYNIGGSNTTLGNDSSTNWFIEMSPSEATHQVFVYCNDTYGNMGLNSTIWFTYDGSLPTIYVDSPANTTYTSTNIALDVSANETISTWWYQLNSNGTNETFTPNTTVTGVDGMNNITVWANDSVGNENSTTIYFTIDTSPPSVNISSPANQSYNSTNGILQLNVSANETIDTWWYQLNVNGTNETFTPNTTIYTTTGGLNNITIWANDTAGNLNTTTVYFTVNSSDPIIMITSPANRSYSTSSVSVQVSADNSISQWKYQLNSGSNNTFSPNTTLSSLSNGAYTLAVWATTIFNRTNVSYQYFTVFVTTQEPEDPGGGTGGLGYVINVTPYLTKSWNAIYPGEDACMDMNDSDIDMTGIMIKVRQTARSVLIKVEQLREAPSGVETYTKARVYNYFNIDARNIDDSHVQNAKLNFRVSKSWMSQNNINISTVSLERWFNSSWSTLVTLILPELETQNHHFFEADSPGFSIFRVVGEESGTEEPLAEYCNNDGACDEWEIPGECADCLACTDGEVRCNGKTIEVCFSGTWQSEYKCQNTCSGGVCQEDFLSPFFTFLMSEFETISSTFTTDMDEDTLLGLYIASIFLAFFVVTLVFLARKRKKPDAQIQRMLEEAEKNGMKRKLKSELTKEEREQERIEWFWERSLKERMKPMAGLRVVEREPKKPVPAEPVPEKPVKRPSSRNILKKLINIRRMEYSAVQEIPIFPVGVAEVEMEKKKAKPRH